MISTKQAADVSQPAGMTPSDQLAALEQQIAQMQKLATLGELLSTTTHEFNNVLMTILNYARMGLRHKDEATRTKALEKILAATQRASKITSTILASARNRSGNFEPTSLKQIVEDTLVLMERELSKYRIAVELSLAEVPPVLAQGNQIQQVLLNLLINARQAMPDGGRVLIRLAHDPSTEMVDLSIRDSGCGIPPDKLPRIFQPFFTTKSGPDETGKGGTGLGLASCRQIIEAHQGRIRVESTVGKGTQFTIKLPANVPSRPLPSQPLPSQPLPSQPAGSKLAPGNDFAGEAGCPGPGLVPAIGDAAVEAAVLAARAAQATAPAHTIPQAASEAPPLAARRGWTAGADPAAR